MEQAKLREEYIEGYRRSVRHHIEGIKVVDEEGNDVTPEKLRQVQREKGLHGRSLDDPEFIIIKECWNRLQHFFCSFKIQNILDQIDQFLKTWYSRVM